MSALASAFGASGTLRGLLSRQTAEEAPAPAPVQTTPIVAITENVDLGTTIAPDNLDPNHPLPSVALGRNISPC